MYSKDRIRRIALGDDNRSRAVFSSRTIEVVRDNASESAAAVSTQPPRSIESIVGRKKYMSAARMSDSHLDYETSPRLYYHMGAAETFKKITEPAVVVTNRGDPPDDEDSLEPTATDEKSVPSETEEESKVHQSRGQKRSYKQHIGPGNKARKKQKRKRK